MAWTVMDLRQLHDVHALMRAGLIICSQCPLAIHLDFNGMGWSMWNNMMVRSWLIGVHDMEEYQTAYKRQID
ncbi:hypothetical protein CRG98_012731 [Punica granatum]|uniref:Uncharacterized protein n=1 Tax=Punica granatum TaxID=22663 RepID=A0A2I0KED1_PUNGR|nr:hypothetical protein CRG98_012731 [Punica granatum]